MKRPNNPERKSDDKTCKAETGKTRAEWFAAIDKSGAEGRASVGKWLQAQKVDPWWNSTIAIDYEAAKGIVEKDGRPRGYSICSTKSVDADAKRTWKAITGKPGLVWGAVKKVRPEKAIVYSWDVAKFGEGSQ